MMDKGQATLDNHRQSSKPSPTQKKVKGYLTRLKVDIKQQASIP